MEKETWKDVVGFEGFYRVSNMGNVKSCERIIYRSNGAKQTVRERLLKLDLMNTGYYNIKLHKPGIRKSYKVHQLVAMAFLGHKRCGFKFVVNHKNFDKLDNRLSNLEVVTNRENANQKHLPSASKYVGVTWMKHRHKWKAGIRVKGILYHLGEF